jgi:hypothetical protein
MIRRRLLLVAFSGVRVRDDALLRDGMTLPGCATSGKAPGFTMLMLAWRFSW